MPNTNTYVIFIYLGLIRAILIRKNGHLIFLKVSIFDKVPKFEFGAKKSFLFK